MGVDSHLNTCVDTQSPKYLEMAQGHISLSISLVICENEVVIMLVIYKYAYVVFTMFFMVEFYYNNIVIYA